MDDDPENEYINPEEFAGELSPPISRISSGEIERSSSPDTWLLNFLIVFFPFVKKM